MTRDLFKVKYQFSLNHLRNDVKGVICASYATLNGCYHPIVMGQ